MGRRIVTKKLTESISKLEKDRLRQIKVLIYDILQTRHKRKGSTVYVKGISIADKDGDGFGPIFAVTIYDKEEVMIHVRELDLLRAEMKQKLGLSLICICSQDRYNIELTFGEKDY